MLQAHQLHTNELSEVKQRNMQKKLRPELRHTEN